MKGGKASLISKGSTSGLFWIGGEREGEWGVEEVPRVIGGGEECILSRLARFLRRRAELLFQLHLGVSFAPGPQSDS